MRLINATIFGFGKWVDYTINFEADSSLYIYGENESGKSTIHNFILFMLFGLPPKQRDFYRPKTSGRMGGRLTIFDIDTGEFTIERFDEVKNGAAVCYGENGEVFDEEWLKECLRGMTLQTYQSIFSFSQTDLAGIKEMTEEELGEVLLGISLSGSTKIYSLEKQLDRRLGELFKPYGKKPAMNQQIENMDVLYTSLQQYKANEATYREKRNKEENLIARIEQLKAELEEETRKQKELEKLLQALPVINDYHHYSSRIATYKENVEFPESGISRLENINQTLLPLQSEITVLKDNEKKLKNKVATIQDEAISSNIYEEVQVLYKLKEKYQEDIKESQKAEDITRKIVMQIETELNRLNIGINQESLETVHFAFHVEKTWNEIKNNSEDIKHEAGKLIQEEKQLKQERNYFLNQIEELEDDVLSEERLKDLHTKIAEHSEFYLLEKLKTESNKKVKDWKKGKIKKEKHIKNMFFLSIVLAILAGVGMFLTNQTWLIQLSIIFLIIGIGQWLFGNRAINEMEKLIGNENTTFKTTQITEDERAEAERLISLHNKKQSEIEHVTEQLKTNELKRLNLLERKKAHQERERQLNEQINVQYEQYPFLSQVEISYWPELFHTMKQVLRLVNEKRQVANEIEQLQIRINEYQLKTSSFFKENNWDAALSIEQKFYKLEEFLAYSDEMNRQLQNYEALTMENSSEQAELIQKIRVVENEKKELFKIAHVNTEEEYYQKAKIRNEKLEMMHAREKTIAQLEKIYPQESWMEYTYERIDEQTIEIELEKEQERIETLEGELSFSREELAMTSANLSTMESSDDYSKTMHQFEMKMEQLNKQAKEWAVLKTAKDILVETKRNYRENHLSNVTRKTSNYFKHLTGGKYIRIFTPNDKKTFQVEADNGIRYAVNELSQGTIDQLYVSLRLAISETMSVKHRVPFIIDDAFVHFDSVRTKRVMEIMKEIAKKQQVIIFTFKKEVLDNSEAIEILMLENPVRII